MQFQRRVLLVVVLITGVVACSSDSNDSTSTVASTSTAGSNTTQSSPSSSSSGPTEIVGVLDKTDLCMFVTSGGVSYELAASPQSTVQLGTQSSIFGFRTLDAETVIAVEGDTVRVSGRVLQNPPIDCPADYQVFSFVTAEKR